MRNVLQMVTLSSITTAGQGADDYGQRARMGSVAGLPEAQGGGIFARALDYGYA